MNSWHKNSSEILDLGKFRKFLTSIRFGKQFIDNIISMVITLPPSYPAKMKFHKCFEELLSFSKPVKKTEEKKRES